MISDNYFRENCSTITACICNQRHPFREKRKEPTSCYQGHGMHKVSTEEVQLLKKKDRKKKGKEEANDMIVMVTIL